jgi:lauroyl/myristoyl acyltransferase
VLRGLLRSVLLWYAFFPHVGLLRLIGPWAAVVVGRGVAWIQWVFLLAVGGGGIGRAMARVLPAVSPGVSVATTLRRYLEVKHQYFVEWNLYPTARGRRFVARTYGDIQGREHVDAALARGRGAIVMAHHFGMFRMIMPALQQAGYQTHTLVLRGADYAGKVHDRVAQAVLRRKVDVETSGDLGVIFHRRGSAFGQMAAILQQNCVLGIAADGMAGSHFVDVPYLGGRTALPTGPAWLCLRSGAPMLPAFSVPEGLARHRVTIHPPLSCEGRSRAAVENLVRAYAELLDAYTRRYPWAWWSWRRLEIGQDPDGVARFLVRELPEEKQAYYSPQRDAEAEPIRTGV